MVTQHLAWDRKWVCRYAEVRYVRLKRVNMCVALPPDIGLRRETNVRKDSCSLSAELGQKSQALPTLMKPRAPVDRPGLLTVSAVPVPSPPLPNERQLGSNTKECLRA